MLRPGMECATTSATTAAAKGVYPCRPAQSVHHKGLPAVVLNQAGALQYCFLHSLCVTCGGQQWSWLWRVPYCFPQKC